MDDALKSHIKAKHLLNKNKNINLTEPGTVPNAQERTFAWKHALDIFVLQILLMCSYLFHI